MSSCLGFLQLLGIIMMPAGTDLKPEYITPTGLRGGVRPDKVAGVPALSHVLTGNDVF